MINHTLFTQKWLCVGGRLYPCPTFGFLDSNFNIVGVCASACVFVDMNAVSMVSRRRREILWSWSSKGLQATLPRMLGKQLASSVRAVTWLLNHLSCLYPIFYTLFVYLALCSTSTWNLHRKIYGPLRVLTLFPVLAGRYVTLFSPGPRLNS